MLSPTAQAAYQHLKSVVNPDGNYKELRTALQTCPLPCLPYVGIFLTDLVFIDDGNQNEVSGLINFTKRRQTATVISLVQSFQKEPYCFEAVVPIQEMIKDAQLLTPDELFDLSLQREPRDRELSMKME